MKFFRSKFIYETPTLLYGIDGMGILYIKYKDTDLEPTASEILSELIRFQRKYTIEKRHIILDAQYIKPRSRELRILLAYVIDTLAHSLAIVVFSPLGKMIVELQLELYQPSCPYKLFEPCQIDDVYQWTKNNML